MTILRSNWFWLLLSLPIGNLGNALIGPIMILGMTVDWSLLALVGFVIAWNIIRWLAKLFRKAIINWLRKHREEIFKD